MKKILLLVILFISFESFSLDVGERRKAILNVIDMELKEVTRLNKINRNRSPKLILRLAELLLEKARHLKEIENTNFLKLSVKERKNLNRRKFFKRSRSYFRQAQKTCLFIISKFKSFRSRGDVYYILAYNSKEFGDSKNARKYFKQAVRYSKKGSKTNNKAKLALADIHYNKREYRSAIKLYEQALKNKSNRNKWYTKDAYNLSWSYFRVKKTKKAIKLMNEVHVLSKNKFYVDMSSNVERDLAFFYTDSGRTKDAVKFYKKKGKNISGHLIKVAKHLKNQGKFTSAEKSFVEALKYTKSDIENIQIHTELLSIYEKFFNIKKHLVSSEFLYEKYMKNKLNSDQVDILKYHLQKMSASIQKRLVGKEFSRRKKTKQKQADQAVKYFNMLAIVDSKNSYKSYFHAAETYFEAGKFNLAADMYDKTFKLAKKRNNKKIERLAFYGLMSTLGEKGISKSTTDRYLIKTYRHFLSINPSSKKSDLVYQRLFSNYISKKDIKNSEQTLLSYKKHFPRNHKTQEAMLAKIMDYYKDKKDFKGVSRWVDRINNGQFKVSSKYAKQVKLLVLSMQFTDVEKARTKGDKVSALKKMVSIYRNPGVRPDAKRNASYNIALLFHKLGNLKLTYEWSKNSLNAARPIDVRKFEESYMVISTEFFNRRHLGKAFSINSLAFYKLCKIKSKSKDIFFKNASIMALADGRIKELKRLLKKSPNCKIRRSKIDEIYFDLARYYREHKQWHNYQSLLEKLSKSKRHWPKLIFEYGKLKSEFVLRANKREAKKTSGKIMKFYKYCSSKNISIPLEGLTVVSIIKERDVLKIQKKLISLKLVFPEKTFNKNLQKKFKIIEKLTEKSLELLKTRSGTGIVNGYKYLVSNYENLAKEISSFTPPNKPAEYVSTFKSAMKKTVRPLLERAKSFRIEARKQIFSNSILTKANPFFTQDYSLPLEVLYLPPRDGVLMDRGGVR